MVHFSDSIIISEGDMDVGEQVTVETDVPEQVGKKDRIYRDYKNFVHSFRLCRMKHNYTLVDVIQQVSMQYRRRLTLRSMTDFEDLVLDKKKCIPIITVLKVWMKDIDKKGAVSVGAAQLHGIVPTNYRRRKTRTSHEVFQGLESYFLKKKTPTPAEYRRLAHELNVEETFVRSWFSGRRGNEKRSFNKKACSDNELNLGWDDLPILEKGLKIPRKSHDISIEVSHEAAGDSWFQTAPPYQVFV